MSLWGYNKNNKKPEDVVQDDNIEVEDETQEESEEETVSEDTSVSKYRELSEAEIAYYRRKYLNLPPTQYIMDKIAMGLNKDIPFEYFVDQDMLTSKNLFELDVDTEILESIKDYIQHKKGEGVFKVGTPKKDVKTVKDQVDKEDSSESNPGDVSKDTPVEESEDEYIDEDPIEKTEIEKKVLKDAEELINKTREQEKLLETQYTNVEERVRELDKEVTPETKIYSQIDVDELKEDLEKTFDVKMAAVEGQYKSTMREMDRIVKSKDETIMEMDGKLKTSQANNVKSLNKLSELRKELVALKSEIKELNSTVFKLNKVKSQYDTIKDDYIKYKEYYEKSSKEVELLVNSHKEEVDRLNDQIEQLQYEVDRVNEVFNEFYTNSDTITTNHIAVCKVPVIYFRMIGEPKYFYSMFKSMQYAISLKGKKVLTVVFKHESIMNRHMFKGWSNLKSVKSVEDSTDQVITGGMDKVQSAKLQAIIEGYDAVIVLDYILDEESYISSPKQTTLSVVKNKKQIDQLGIVLDNIVSEEHTDVLDLTYSDDMTKYTNDKVKASFYIRRFNKWLDEVLNKEAKL